MTTILVIRNGYMILSSESEDLLENIHEVLSFRDSSQAYTWGGRFDPDRIKTVRFSKYVSDLDLPSLKIPIGFLEFIESVLEDVEHSVIDKRPKIQKIKYAENKVMLKGISLREHQVKAIVAALNTRRGIIMSPTGSGKTEIFLAILSALKQPSLVLFNRQQLAQQTVTRARARGLDAGLVQGKNVIEQTITMATIQSLHKIENLKKYKNLILDEVHHVGSKSYQEALRLSHWHRIYGFSATPVNPHKMDLKSAKIIASVGPVIFDASAKDLMAKGIIATPTIYIVPIAHPEEIEEFNFADAEEVGIKHNKYRHEVIKELAEMHRKEKVLILTKYVDQGKEIQELIPGAPFIWNETPVKERLRLIEEFEKDNIDILIASRILDEGIDIQNFKVLIIGSAGLAIAKTIQRLGRGLRATDEKKTVDVYDFMDKTNPKLEKHSKERIKTYKAYGYDNIIELKE